MAQEAFQAAAKFPGLNSATFQSDCESFASLLSSATGELESQASLSAELDDLVVDIVGEGLTSVVRAIMVQTPVMTAGEAESACHLLVACGELCATLLDKQWTQSEGVIQQVRVLLGEGGHLDAFYASRGVVESILFGGRSFPMWPLANEKRRVLLALGNATLDKRVTVDGQDGIILSFNPESNQLGIKTIPAGETVLVDAGSPGLDLADIPQEPVIATQDANAPFVRIILPPTAEDALGRWIFAKRIDSKLFVTEDGERLELDLMGTLTPSQLKRYSQVPTEVEQCLTRAAKAVDGVFGADQPKEWTAIPAPCARFSRGRSIFKPLILERFLRKDGLAAAIRLVWRSNVELSTVCSLVDRIAEFLTPEARSKIADTFGNAIMWKTFTEAELKTSLPELDVSLEGAFRTAAVSLQSPKNAAYLHRHRMQTWFTLVRSSSLSQRLLGMNRLTSLILAPLTGSANNLLGAQAAEVAEHVRRTAVRFVVDERVVERIYGEARHLEVVKRSTGLLHFLAKMSNKDGGLNSSQLEALWTAGAREEGETMRTIHQLIVELLPSMADVELKATFLSSKLEEMKRDMDERSLEFIHQLTLATAGDFKNVDHPGISLLWDFVFNRPVAKLSHTAVELALKLLAEVFGKTTTPKRRLTALDQCCKFVAANDPERVPQALLLMRGLVETFPDEDERTKSVFGSMLMGSRPDSRRSVLAQLESKAKLLRTVVSGLERAPSGTVLFGQAEQTSVRLEFISFALRSNSSLKLGDKLVETLWKSCVVGATSDETAQMSLRWFGRAHTAPPSNGTVPSSSEVASPLAALFFSEAELGSTAQRAALNDDAEQWVLLKGFPSLPRARLSKLAAQVLVDYFLASNRKAKLVRCADESEPGVVSVFAGLDEDGRIKRVLRSLERISPLELLGAEQLWRGCVEGPPAGRENGQEAAQKQGEGEDDVFHLLSSVLCRLTLNTGSLKDTKRAADLHGAFLQRCVQGIEKAGEDTLRRRRYIRLLKAFLLRASASPSETCRIVLLPPLPGTPGSLSRREEQPRSRTGAVRIPVSLGATLGELRKEIVPRALDYTGTDVVALRLVHRALNLDSMSAASVKFSILPAALNSKTLRELGFERNVVIQCFEQSSSRDVLSFDDMDDPMLDDDDDDDDETYERDRLDLSDPLEQAFEDATYSKLNLQGALSLEEEIDRACAPRFDANVETFPPKWPSKTLSVESLSSNSAAAEVLRPHAALGETLLKLLSELAAKVEPSSTRSLQSSVGKRTESVSRRDLLDIWECFLCMPTTHSDEAPVTLDLKSLSVAKDLFRILAVLRQVVTKSDGALAKLRGSDVPQAVLEVLGHLRTFEGGGTRTNGLVFAACLRILPLLDAKEKTTCAKHCLDWALGTECANILKRALFLAERCVENCDDIGPVLDRLDRLWTSRLMANASNALPINHKARMLVAASAYRLSRLRGELNVFGALHAATLEEVLDAAKGVKAEYELASGQGQKNRRRIARFCETLFLYLSRFVETCSFAVSSPNPLKHWFQRCADILITYNPEDEEERIFSGLARFTRGLLLRKDFSEVQRELSDVESSLTRFLTTKCLFGPERKSAPSAIESCLGLVSALVVPKLRDAPFAQQELFDALSDESLLVPSSASSSSAKQSTLSRYSMGGSSSASRRSRIASYRSHTSGWALTDVMRFGSASRKHHLQYAGIGNLGATCYQNSLLQQLFHVTQFSSKLLDAQQHSDEVLQSLQVMFASMFVSSETAIETRPFCAVFKDYDGRPISHIEQKDVQEFCDMLFTRLEQASPDVKRLLEESFGGEYIQRTQSLDPSKPYTSDRVDPFYLVQVDIKGKLTLRDALDGLVAKTKLVGENRCELPGGDKVDATVQTLFKRLPPHLMVNLKRFEFQYDTMTKAKLDDYLSFPLELDLTPYMDPTSVKPSDEGDFHYELNGILVHSGGADSGHYYSFIRERVARDERLGRQWFEFNDQMVWPYAEDRIAKDCFGGFDRFPRPNNQFVEIPRSHSAYILVYDRVSVVAKWQRDPLMMFGARLKGNQVSSHGDRNGDEDGENGDEDAVSEEEDEEEEDEGEEQGAGAAVAIASSKHQSGTLSRRGRPFGSFTVPVALQFKVQVPASSPRSGSVPTASSNDAVLFHPMLTRLLRDVLEKELHREGLHAAASGTSISKEPGKDLFLAFEICLMYLVQVLARTALLKRRRVLDDYISVLERAARGSHAIASRCLERLSIRAEVLVKPVFFECPSRIFRKRFAELILLCTEACLVQGAAVDAGVALSQTQAQHLEVPTGYLHTGEVPLNRAVWMLDSLFALGADSLNSSHGPLPASEFSALLVEMMRLDSGLRAHAVSRKCAKTALELLVKRSARARSGSKSHSVVTGAAFDARRLVLSRPQPACELVLALAEGSTAAQLGAEALAGERFMESALRLMDFTSCVRGASLLFASLDESVTRALDRLANAKAPEDFSLLGDLVRTHHAALQTETVLNTVDVLMLMSQQPGAENSPLEEVALALKCLGTVVAHSKAAGEHLKQAHKKALASWTKDMMGYMRAQMLKAVESAPLLPTRSSTAPSRGNNNA